MFGPNRQPVESLDSSTDLLPANTRSSKRHDDHTGARWSRRAVLGAGLGTAVAAVLPGVLSGRVRASGGLDDTLRELTLAANGRRVTSSLAPRIVTRAQWGAHEGFRRGPSAFDSMIRSVVVHHTATTPAGSPAEQVRAIYEEQLARGYGDVAYHWLITEDGTVFEGRWAQDYPVGQLHDGEDRHGNNVRGGATKHHNTETIAVALIGDFTRRRPSSAALASLVDVIAWKCARWELSPLGVSPYITSLGTFRHLPAIVGHRDCRVTECPGNALYAMLPNLRRQVAARLADGGQARHWMVGADGLLAYGTLDGATPTDRPVAGVAPQPGGRGVWAWSSDGGVFALGGAPFAGSLGDRRGRDGPVTSFAPTPSGRGYRLATANGGVFAFGDASFRGSRGGKPLAAPVISIVPTRTGQGYWLFATDGGVFAYGDAPYRGGATRIGLVAPIVAAAATSSGTGYWLAGRDGGVFAFGDAAHHGSAAPGSLTSPIVGIVPSPGGGGYGLLLADGGVIRFGDFTASHRHEGSLLDAAQGAIG